MINDGKKFNILYLHNESIMGGAEISLLNLVKRLNRKLFIPHFTCSKEGPFIDELNDVEPILAIGFPLGRLGALLERVQLFISNDTGPFHIADALNIPFVVIFGPENFYRYGPYNTKSKSRIVTGMKISCSPCLKYECRTHECMESITPDMVWEEVESLMKEIIK